jgi:hypothetical protein
MNGALRLDRPGDFARRLRPLLELPPALPRKGQPRGIGVGHRHPMQAPIALQQIHCTVLGKGARHQPREVGQDAFRVKRRAEQLPAALRNASRARCREAAAARLRRSSSNRQCQMPAGRPDPSWIGANNMQVWRALGACSGLRPTALLRPGGRPRLVARGHPRCRPSTRAPTGPAPPNGAHLGSGRRVRCRAESAGVPTRSRWEGARRGTGRAPSPGCSARSHGDRAWWSTNQTPRSDPPLRASEPVVRTGLQRLRRPG